MKRKRFDINVTNKRMFVSIQMYAKNLEDAKRKALKYDWNGELDPKNNRIHSAFRLPD